MYRILNTSIIYVLFIKFYKSRVEYISRYLHGTIPVDMSTIQFKTSSIITKEKKHFSEEEQQ